MTVFVIGAHYARLAAPFNAFAVGVQNPLPPGRTNATLVGN
jgi:hypothetical protein